MAIDDDGTAPMFDAIGMTTDELYADAAPLSVATTVRSTCLLLAIL